MGTDTLIPLESNPDVMNKFLRKLGVTAEWNVVDVMGLDSDMLSWVPRPVLAVLLLFPVSMNYEQFKEKEEKLILSKGQHVSSDVFYIKQNLRNACGTFALLHSVANNTDKIRLLDGPLKTYLEKAKPLNAAERSKLLGQSDSIISAHKELAQEGQTETPNAEEPVNHHFIAFVHKEGILYELDGSKAFPINHGPTTPSTLLEDAAKVCQQFMARDPDEMRFTVVALTATD